jgi:hypothetical protein
MSLLNKLKQDGFCGASSLQGEVLGSLDTLKSGVTDAVSGTIGNASDITSAIEGNLTSLKTKVTGMVGELNITPNINLQSELKSLVNLDIGSFGYLSKFANLKSQFGNFIDLDALGDLKSIDICSLDNLSLPSGTTEVIKQSADVIQATTKEVITTKGEITKYVMEPNIILEEVTEGFTDITENLQSSLDKDLVTDTIKKFTEIV